MNCDERNILVKIQLAHASLVTRFLVSITKDIALLDYSSYKKLTRKQNYLDISREYLVVL